VNPNAYVRHGRAYRGHPMYVAGSNADIPF
jgi:hypothetical protein